MNSRFSLAFAALTLSGSVAYATGLATCDSGPKSGWQPVEKLEQQLKEKGYTVRRIKEDGGATKFMRSTRRANAVSFIFIR